MTDTLAAITQRIRALDDQIIAAVHDGRRINPKGVTPMKPDIAEQAIEAPFLLSDDHIVEHTDEKTDSFVCDVVRGGKVLFSTVTRPLAFAWIGGHNAAIAKHVKGGASNDYIKDATSKEPGGAAIKEPKPPIPANIEDAQMSKNGYTDTKTLQSGPRKRVAL